MNAVVIVRMATEYRLVQKLSFYGLTGSYSIDQLKLRKKL